MISLKRTFQDLDFSKPIEGKDLDLATYKEKFLQWDSVVENDLLNHPDEQIRNRAALLLEDETIYSYAFFRDENGDPFVYAPYQDAIANCQHDFTWDNPNRFILFRAANQIGKSRLLVGKAIQKALNEKNVNIVIISKSLPQSQFLLAQIRQTLNNSKFVNWKESVGETANTTQLTFNITEDDMTFTNRIICAPAGEGSLGYPIHYMFLDEFDFYEYGKNFFWKVAYPRTNKTKGQIICFSNPNPDIPKSNSILWELWKGDLFQRKFWFNFLDAPWNTQAEFDVARRNSNEYIFLSTHMGEFSEDAGSFLTHAEITAMMQQEWNNDLPPSDRPVYIGVDLGKMRDSTVISIGIPKKPLDDRDKFMDLDVPYQEELPLKTGYDRIAERLRELQIYYKERYQGVAVTAFDSTGQKTFGDLLRSKNIQATGVDFSAKKSSKDILYGDLKLMAQNRKLKVVYSRQCEKQLAGLEFKLTTANKYKKVENKTASIHDDYPDSLAILVHVAVKPSAAPVSATIAYSSSTKSEKYDKIWKMMGIQEASYKMVNR